MGARAEQLADKAIDLSYAKALGQRARQWRDIAAEISVLERDPCTVAYTIAPTPSRKGASALKPIILGTAMT